MFPYGCIIILVYNSEAYTYAEQKLKKKIYLLCMWIVLCSTSVECNPKNKKTNNREQQQQNKKNQAN